MNNIRELLENLNKNNYTDGTVDLHIHTICSDGKGNYNQIVASAHKKGYKLIAITDHNTVEVHKNIRDEILITGAEFDCWFKYIYLHILAYGIDINAPELETFYAKIKSGTKGVLSRIYVFRNLKKLIDAIHSAGGVAILAHPACCWAFNLESLIKNLADIGLDGIEVFYPYPRFRSIVKFHSVKTVQKIAEKFPDLLKTGGTDFHGEIF